MIDIDTAVLVGGVWLVFGHKKAHLIVGMVTDFYRLYCLFASFASFAAHEVPLTSLTLSLVFMYLLSRFFKRDIWHTGVLQTVRTHSGLVGNPTLGQTKFVSMSDSSWKGSNGGGKGWDWDNQSNSWKMPQIQSDFLDWLLSDPKDPASKNAWCEQNGLHPDTPKRWKRDKRFNEEWDRRAKEKNISVDRVQSVVDSLHTAAVNGDTKAASLYLQYIDRFTPKRIIRTEDAETKSLSDEDLLAELRQLTEEFQ